jgi:glycosyltransferase involved in cell wall biosynthesis
VSECENGYLVPVGDVQELSNRLAILIKQPDLREEMGRKAAARVKENYSIETMLLEHIALYQSVAPGVGQP